MKKIFNILTIGVLAAISLTSCERDLTSLNENPKQPEVLPSANLLAMGQQQFFYYTFTGSVNFNNFRFFTQQWTETTYTDETNYNLVTRTQPRNNWNRMYVYSLNNFETAKKNLVSEGGSAVTKQNQLATLEISQIAVWETLVDTYGDIPYSEALKADEGQFSPKYDDAKSIYTSLLSRIDAAIASINTSAAGYSTGDLVYAGDMTKWKHLANSIKLRLALNLADTDAAAAKSAAESAVTSGVISSESESYSLTFAGGTFNNPIYDDLVASGRQDFLPTNLVTNLMNSKNDPRREVWFTTVGGVYNGGVFGTLNSFANFSQMSDFFLANNAPANLLSYTEVLFMKAEAAQRGYSVGGTAESFYNAAIAASMAENGVSATDSAAYVVANPYNAANWKQSIGQEAWIALFNRGFASWLFTRRLDAPTLILPPNNQLNGLPVRMPYSDQEYVLNKANVNAAAAKIGGDEATKKLFWDVN
ncbi:MAG: SusD/RagB family nutrient-binding outer membrane lipoprotein [Chryseobacterium sp.]|nr:MAG: SusD/RagB family nutrient-binding outer membrane lipoprotein [Chryseobacterium sp.]